MEEAGDRKRKRQPLLALVAPNSRLGCTCAAAESASSLALPDVLDAPVSELNVKNVASRLGAISAF